MDNKTALERSRIIGVKVPTQEDAGRAKHLPMGKRTVICHFFPRCSRKCLAVVLDKDLISRVFLKRKFDSKLCLETQDRKTQLAKTLGPCQRADLHKRRIKIIRMGKNKEISQPSETDMPSVSLAGEGENKRFCDRLAYTNRRERT